MSSITIAGGKNCSKEGDEATRRYAAAAEAEWTENYVCTCWRNAPLEQDGDSIAVLRVFPELQESKAPE